MADAAQPQFIWRGEQGEIIIRWQRIGRRVLLITIDHFADSVDRDHTRAKSTQPN
jgi:hypothetical protein